MSHYHLRHRHHLTKEDEKEGSNRSNFTHDKSQSCRYTDAAKKAVA